MPDIFKSDTFWSAFSALVAFATMVGVIWGAITAMIKSGKWRKLQAELNNEQKFYEEQARRVSLEPIYLPEQSATERYLSSIRKGILTIADLPIEKRQKIKDKINQLIAQLRATHATLVKALEPFTTADAKKFFTKFDKFNQEFGTLYNSGNIPHIARTHCGEVDQIINDIVIDLESEQSENRTPPETINKIREIGYSMASADQETIVPIMRHILSKTEVELSLIHSAIRDGNMNKAIWLKERYKFDIKNLYVQLEDALTKMSALAQAL